MIDIRVATKADTPAWLRMRRALFGSLDSDFQNDEAALYLKDTDKRCFLAVDGSSHDILGFAEGSLRNIVDGCLTSPVGFIEALYVEPEARGRGAGCGLVNACIRWFEDEGCKEIATDALLDDESAQRFHRKMGFVETYRIVQFKLRR